MSNENFNNKKQWFLDRIGKTIYRDSVGCQCETCINVGKHGLTITDELHADYLTVIHFEGGIGYYDEPLKKENE